MLKQSTRYYCSFIWAWSWQNLSCAYVNSKGADQPVHLHSLISTFAIRCWDSIVSVVAMYKIQDSSFASVAEQACLSPWSQTPKTGFLVTWFNYTGEGAVINVDKPCTEHFCWCKQ